MYSESGRRGEMDDCCEIGCAVTPPESDVAANRRLHFLARARRREAGMSSASFARATASPRRVLPPRARASRRPSPRVARASAEGREALASASSPRELVFTYLGGNGWRVHFPRARARVLCDPWLVGDLTFWNLPALYVGRGPHVADRLDADADEVILEADACDLLLLSQGWDDHAHRPTLRALRKDIPVVASPAAASVARRLGFRDVREARDGDRVEVAGVTVTVAAGASVGPPWSAREAAFIIVEGNVERPVSNPLRVYYEPHCSYDARSVAEAVRRAGGAVDVAVTPAANVAAAGFPLVRAGDAAAELYETLGRPAVIVPLRNGELEQAGFASRVVRTEGDGGGEEIIAAVAKKSAPGTTPPRIVNPSTRKPVVIQP